MPSRSELSSAVKSLPIWSEISKEYRGAIPKAAKGGDYAKCLQDAMDNGRAGKNVYKECAKNAGVSAKLSAAWSD